jgi:hypothetical protein
MSSPTIKHTTADGRSVKLHLNPAIGARQAAENLAKALAADTPGVTEVYVEAGRTGSDATIRIGAGAWKKVDLDAFFAAQMAKHQRDRNQQLM